MSYEHLDDIIWELAETLRPPERLTVSDAAEKYRYVNQQGAYVGWWDNMTAPYMVEPMNVFASREHKSMAFIGPAQSGKTDAIIVNGIAYSVKVDPMDLLVFCPTQGAARDFSMRRIDRLHRHSQDIGEVQIKSRDADNIFDKHYKTGMMLTLSWPSVTELAGRPVGRILMTDYDRMDDDIGGDGSPFDLASKRTTTFGSFAMCAAESSPSRPITDPKWIAKSPHEAPPCTGIVGLYNRGDRRRWYWPCLECWEWFEGKFELLTWDDSAGSNQAISETVRMACPHCGSLIHPDDRHEMQQWGLWVPDGMHVDEKGRLRGKKPRTTFASFWLRGTAAAFVTWPTLVNIYLDAKDEYDRTLSEEALKKFWNNDMGGPYVPANIQGTRTPETMMSNATDYPEGMIPEGVRFTVATVDVQKDCFSVQVTGIMPGRPFDMVPIDRFEIRKSKRLDEDGHPMPVAPASYLEDWELIKEQVMDREYPLADGSGRTMAVRMTGCDSGGKAGVTDRAYDFYRKLRSENRNARFILIKGASRPNVPRTAISYPDSQKKDNKSAARGDIPVLFINTNMLKDTLDGRLEVKEPGKGMIHLPRWLPHRWYSEMCAEVRTDKGWENPKKLSNEAWDLCNYAQAICISPLLLSIEKVDWENPPAWAQEWDKNVLVMDAPPADSPENAEMRVNRRHTPTVDFSKLGEALG